MSESTSNYSNRPNKARLDNRRGCSVGHAFRGFDSSSRFDAHPRPICARALTYPQQPNRVDTLQD
jgi:hypothetical protein